MKRLLITLTLCAVAWAQNPQSAKFPAATVTDNDLPPLSNLAQDKLASPMDLTQATVPLVDASKFTVPVTVRVGNEFIFCATKVGNELQTCSRHVENSDAAIHAQNVTVSAFLVAGTINQAFAEIKALQAGDFGARTVKGATFQSNDTTHSGAELLSGLTSGGLAFAVADVAGTLTTLLYPTDSSTATTGKVLAIGDVVTCPTLPATMPTTCRATSWATSGAATNGTSGQILTSNGAGGFGTAMSWPASSNGYLKNTGGTLAWDAGTSAPAGWVTPPAAPDATGTQGQYSGDASYGYLAIATDTWIRWPKDATWLPTVATPTFSPASPYSGVATDVTVSTATSGASKVYCTDTNNTCTPTTSYTAPVNMASTGYLRAKATKGGYNDSAVASWQGTISAGGGTIGYYNGGAPGGLTQNWDKSLILASKFAAPANGSNGTFYIYCSSPATTDVAVGVYSDNSGSPNALLSGSTTTVTCTGTAGWVSAAITGVSWVSGTNYWLAFQPTSATYNATFYRDAGTTNQEAYGIPGGGWTGTLPSTFSGGGGFENFKISVYVTY